MLEAYLHLFNEDPLLEVLISVIHQFKTSVDPKRSNFRKCEYYYDSLLSLHCCSIPFVPAVNGLTDIVNVFLMSAVSLKSTEHISSKL